MYKLVGKQESAFAVLDTDDNAVDILSEVEVSKCLNLDLRIEGVTRTSENEISFDPSFIQFDGDKKQEDLEVEEEDDYDDYDAYDEPYIPDMSSLLTPQQDSVEGETDDDDAEDADYATDTDSEQDDYQGYDDADDDDYGDDYGDDTDSEALYEEDDDDDYDDYFAEDNKYNAINELYRILSPEQSALLKRYYLWYSQRIFDEGRKNSRNLTISNNPRKIKKLNKLQVMRNQGGMWAYAGFIDTGFRGGGHCTLGHALRFIHLAWDVSVSDIETSFFGDTYDLNIEEIIESNNCIKFGIDCISDFFEIDSDYVLKLKTAQKTVISDMELMSSIYTSGKSDSCINSLNIMDEVMNHVTKLDAKSNLLDLTQELILPKGLISFYSQFRRLNILPPKSLILEIRDTLIGWNMHKFYGLRLPKYNAFERVLSKLTGSTYKSEIAFMLQPLRSNVFTPDSNFFTIQKPRGVWTVSLLFYLVRFFQLNICGCYAYNATTLKDEGGCSESVRIKIEGIRNCIFWSDALSEIYTLDYLKKVLNMVRFADLMKNEVVADYLKVTELVLNQDTGLYDYTVLSDERADTFWTSYKSCVSMRILLVSSYVSKLKEVYDYEKTLKESEVIYPSELTLLNMFSIVKYGDIRISRTLSGLISCERSLAGSGGAQDYRDFFNKPLDECLKAIEDAISILESNRNDFNKFYNDYCEYLKNDKNAYILEENRREQELLDLEKKRKDEEIERAREEERKAKEAEKSLVKSKELSRAEVIQFCSEHLDAVKNEKSLKFALSVLDTLVSKGIEGSDKQFYYVGLIYKHLTGEEVAKPEKVRLDDRKDIEDAIDKVLADNSLLKGVSDLNKTLGVLNSIKKYRLISINQMKYAETALNSVKL